MAAFRGVRNRWFYPVSTVLTLILVPALYCSFAGTGIKRNRKKMKASRELNDYYQAHKTEMTKGKKE